MSAVLLALCLTAPPAPGTDADGGPVAGVPPVPPAPTVSEDGVRVWENAVFREANGAALKLDLALPPADPDGRTVARPLLVWVHGGGWIVGGKWRYRREIAAAARRGYAAATVEYRLSKAGVGGRYVDPYPAAYEDVRAAVAWLAARADRFGIDPHRIALIGDSAGGHLSLRVGLDSAGDTAAGDDRIPPVAAVVNLYGVTDLTTYYEGSGHARAVLNLFLGGHLEDARDRYRDASPVAHVDADDPPVLTLHGTADPIVPFAQAEELDRTLRAAGVPSTLVPMPGGTHGLFRERAEVRRRTYEFLDAILRPAGDAAGRP